MVTRPKLQVHHMATHPKITQEGLEELTSILIQTVEDATYLDNSPYSPRARARIRETVRLIREAEWFGADDPEDEVVLEGDDTWGVIRSLNIGIKQMEKLSKSSDSDSAKLGAVKGLFDMNQKKVELLEKVIGMSKVAAIEAIVKQFFREIPKNDPKREDEANRFLAMLEQIKD